tara:strand:- start:387 stop:770 length:384 start_codon:yes stop_codon:yes gene_type:complete
MQILHRDNWSPTALKGVVSVTKVAMQALTNTSSKGNAKEAKWQEQFDAFVASFTARSPRAVIFDAKGAGSSSALATSTSLAAVRDFLVRNASVLWSDESTVLQEGLQQLTMSAMLDIKFAQDASLLV